ncbi:hypothetical protein F4775DRAFT_589744 [Biscogniauxia sp. FL1348]|nr:hypothetical protein F4775DRAFT_589744 [Biscogniauxia sp. FL1348]
MPIIEGQKMSCAPCIRGHRSTKCSHANERVLVPVRKPGRPLSSCPHTPGKPCHCGGVTAAIPRKGKCRCASSAQDTNGAPSNVKTEPPNPENPPLSPTRATNFRVQKAVSKPPSRKQSYDPAALERTDPNAFNILSPHGFPLSIDGAIERSDSSIVPPHFVSPLPPRFEQAGGFPRQLADYQPTSVSLDTEVTPSFTRNGNLAGLSPAIAPRNGVSSRSGFASGTSSAPHHRPASDTRSSYEPPPEETACHCCAPQPQSQSPTTLPQSQLSTQFQCQTQPHDDLDLSRYGSSVSSGINGTVSPIQAAGLNHIYPTHYHQPTLYTYPPPYGTLFYPVQQAHWQQAIEASALGNPQSLDCNQFDPFTAHQCGCGSDCQCVGCTAHPFNEATRDYIRSAMDSQYDTTATAEEYAKSIITEARKSMSISTPPASLPPNGDGSSPSPTSEAASSDNIISGPSLEDQTLSAENFFFVQYDVEKMGLGCDGKSISCPCGDDCTCVGCMIHGKAMAGNFTLG